MTSTDAPADLEVVLRSRFGLERFRPGQREVIENVLHGRDVLCVMPTGGGKSLCYQFPAVYRGGLTLVVSPLIALMKDQVDSLTQRGLRATLINSTLDPSEQAARIAQMEAGEFNLVYVAPERFRSSRFVSTIARIKPALLAIDEAHCISQWGHDFRPDYSRLGAARKRLGSPPCIALTATATDLVRRDIADQLDLDDPALFVAGFDRPNLSYAVVEARRDAEKLQALAATLDAYPGPSVVYASSRARCVEVADFLRAEKRRDAVVYHAGLTREQRHEAQDRFMGGDADIVVATNAFGMGVDKADIRSVVHFNMPGTLEAYYQEAGRAGRDGRPAACVLLYAAGDRKLQELFIENEYPPREVVFRIYNFLARLDADPIELTQSEIKDEIGLDVGEGAVGSALRLLEGAGAIERFLPRENMAIVRINPDAAGSDVDLWNEPRSLVDRINPQAHIQRVVLLGVEGLVNRRYGEPVYFHPDEFAAALGLDRPALGRALRALTTELPIDYVPPFRGNAIRVADRSRKPRDIEIDFAALQKRKDREYDKLDRMIRYAKTTKCRRSYILGYFGDGTAERVHCGHCDNCGPLGEAKADAGGPGLTVVDTAEGREVILKILSGVARAKGGFGKTIVAQMLNGSGSEKMDRFGLKTLSTYGILPEFKQQEIAQILDALNESGHVVYSEVERFRPVVELTDDGWNVLKTRPTDPITLNLTDELGAKLRLGGLRAPAARPARGDGAEAPGGEPFPDLSNDPLYQQLKSLRTDLARELKVPSYHIFPNETLDALVRTRPTTPQALAGVKGLGPARIERHGALLLEIINGLPVAAMAVEETLIVETPPSPAPARAPAAPVPAPAPAPAPPAAQAPSAPPRTRSRPYVPTEEWTWRLLDRGFSLDDTAAVRGLERSVVIRHVALAAREGKPVPLTSFLDEETLDIWNDWHARYGDEPPPDLDDADRELWPLFILIRRRG